MPSRAHEKAHSIWATRLVPIALAQLTPPPHDIGCSGTGAPSMFNYVRYIQLYDNLSSPFIPLPAYRLGSRQKQADAGIEPDFNPPQLPSIVVEVGNSESLTQLKIDAKLWLEHSAEV